MSITSQALRKGYAETSHGQIHYRACGLGSVSGDPVLFFHRTPVCSASFVPVLQALAGWRPMVAFDTPGFGQSFTPAQDADMAVFIEAFAQAIADLEIARYHLVGHHTGSHFATELAAIPGSGALSLMIDGAMVTSAQEREQKTPPNPAPIITREGEYLGQTWAFLQPYYTVFDAVCVHHEFVGAMHSTFTRAACMNVVRKHDMAQALGRVGCRVLASAACDDVFAPHLERVHEISPQAVIATYGPAGIASPELQTERFAQLVQQSATLEISDRPSSIIPNRKIIQSIRQDF